jgi:hypothetical protein
LIFDCDLFVLLDEEQMNLSGNTGRKTEAESDSEDQSETNFDALY